MSAAPKRGRPPKYGRPGRLLAFTVPDDVREWLESIHRDPGWALVRLFEDATSARSNAANLHEVPVAEIAMLAGRRGLIVVDRQAMPPIPGIALIPLSDTQAFLALEPGRGLADVELAVIEACEEAGTADVRRTLAELRSLLRSWRKDPHLVFVSRSIIVVERKGAVVGARHETARPRGSQAPRRS